MLDVDSKGNPRDTHLHFDLLPAVTIGQTGPAGPQGAAGVIGAAGATGPTGSQGPAGASIVGPAGPQGTPGPTGSPGANGTNGVNGAVGSQGIPGVAGATGAQGTPGATGPIGLTGATGAAGLTGAVGQAGPAGSIGATGLIGATGPVGLTGATGPIGLTGATGPAGVQGSIGLTGAVGQAGPAGSIGATGANGAQGASGLTGAVGATGAAGGQGPTGLTGAASTVPGPAGGIGATGLTGVAGPAGRSPFQGTWSASNAYLIGDIVVRSAPGSTGPFINTTGLYSADPVYDTANWFCLTGTAGVCAPPPPAEKPFMLVGSFNGASVGFGGSATFFLPPQGAGSYSTTPIQYNFTAATTLTSITFVSGTSTTSGEMPFTFAIQINTGSTYYSTCAVPQALAVGQSTGCTISMPNWKINSGDYMLVLVLTPPNGANGNDNFMSGSVWTTTGTQP